MQIIKYTPQEVKGIRAFCALLALVNVCLFSAAIVNIRYLFILRVKRTSIAIFYVFLLVGTAITTMTMLSIVISPITDYEKGWFEDFRPQTLFFRISITISLLYGLEVYLIIQRLRLNVLKLYQLMDEKQAKCRKIVGLLVVSIQIIIIMVAQLAPYIDQKYRIALVVFSTLIGFITYTHTAYSLIKVLNQNDKEGFQKEIKHVKI